MLFSSRVVDIFCRFPTSVTVAYRLPGCLYYTVHNCLVMSEKLLILNPQWPLNTNAQESPAAANSALCCCFSCYWEFRLLLSKPCGWLLINTLEAASSLTDRNAIQGQSRNTSSDLTYTIETCKALSDGFYTSFGWAPKIKVGELIYLLAHTEIPYTILIIHLSKVRQQNISCSLNVSGIILWIIQIPLLYLIQLKSEVEVSPNGLKLHKLWSCS